MKRYLPFILIVLVASGALASGFLIFRHQKATLAALEVASTKDASDGKPGAVPPHIRGSADAPIVLEEFGDFQCPPCGNFAVVLGKIEKDYGTRLRVIFREYPLQMHAHADQAARVAEAAGMQDRFWEMYDQLYANQNTWSRAENVTEIFSEYAGKLGLDLQRFAKDVESKEARERIVADQARADSLGVTSTPTIFLNGHQLPPILGNEPSLRKVIDDLLAGKPFPTPTPSPSSTPTPAISPTPPLK